MKKAYTIPFLLLTTVFYGHDKLVTVNEKMQEVFALIEKENTEELKQLSTKKGYCLLYYENAPKKGSYLLDSKTFFKKRFANLFDPEPLKRISQGEKKIIAEDTANADCIALFTVYKQTN